MMVIAGFHDRCRQIPEPVSPSQSGLGRLERKHDTVNVQIRNIGGIVRFLEPIRKKALETVLHVIVKAHLAS